ncbi:DUF4186 domain-containing protein [uncultured Microbacterium sp.]|uniref:DUF4186 domain-containing protein n=1 Tax=uncultured Microbacterium sp. TaxID=191216 RepID=UPI0025E86B3C|nr:DUF4186 domain-containing protein [uncultured Microbacterium sp.]
MQDPIDRMLARITRLPFRATFHLRAPEYRYAVARGADTIRRQAGALIDERLAPAHPRKDGSQTPWGGHPVFRAQHATATCCRTCLQINHRIPKGRVLSDRERGYVVDVICRWIDHECASFDRSTLPPAPPALF